MKKNIFILSLIVLLAFSSCVSSTKSFIKGIQTDESLSVEEKLIASGSKELQLPYPECYFDARLFLDRYIEVINSAEDYIFISTFLASYSEGLDELYSAIAAKAEEGVRVYFIMDSVSSFDMTESRKYMTPLFFLKDHGVHLVDYNSISALHLIAPQSMLIRDHRKMVVVDGKIAILGGMNMNYISLGADNIDLQRDSMYVFESANLASALVDEFVVVWNEASVEKIKRSDFATYEESADKELPLKGYLFNMGPGSDASMSDMYSSLISSAKEEIIMLPYLAFLNDDMYESLERAIARGVKVKMYLPIDSREYVQAANFYDYHRLVEAGVEVYYEYTGGDTGKALLHQKLMVVDGRYTVIGSANFNMRSMKLSYEIALTIDDENFAKASLAQVEDVSAEMVLLDLESAKRLKKEKGNLFNYLFSYYGG